MGEAVKVGENFGLRIKQIGDVKQVIAYGEAAPLIEAARARGMPLALTMIDDPEIARLYERRLVLVRPDGHVAWRGDRAPADPAGIIDRVRGAG